MQPQTLLSALNKAARMAHAYDLPVFVMRSPAGDHWPRWAALGALAGATVVAEVQPDDAA